MIPTPPLASFPTDLHVLVQGASRGIGLEITRQLASSPRVARLYATCRRPDRAAELADLGDYRSRIHLLPLDVEDEASIAAASDAVRQESKSLHLLINCSGILHRGLDDESSGGEGPPVRPERRLEDVDPAMLAESFRINAIGPLLVAKHFAALLPRRERCVLASLSARVGSIGDNRLGGWYGYRASKAALNQLHRSLSIELRRRCRGAVCVVLHPGTVDTDLSRPFQERVPPGRLFPVSRAARQLLAVIDRLDEEQNGGFIAWDGSPIPW